VFAETADGGAVAEITALLDAATGRMLGGDGGGWKDLVEPRRLQLSRHPPAAP
jgi:hypothetical protein